MKTWKSIAMTLALSLASPVLTVAEAAPAAKSTVKSKPATVKRKAPAAAKSPEVVLHDRLTKLKRSYRLGDVNKRTMWTELAKLYDQGQKMSLDDRISLLQTQSSLLVEANYPILAAIYTSQALQIAGKPFDKDLEPSWDVLRRVSERRPIQSLVEVVADKVVQSDAEAPVFGSDWFYFAANAAAKNGDVGRALSLYGRLKIDDRYFFPSKYQQAMLYVDQNDLKSAEASLKAILYPTAHKMSPLSETKRGALVDYAYLALGRIYYEQERFVDSLKMYRSVDREGKNFYDALWEQSWSFFMAGYPMHALGALHGAESPFYADVFNPEAPILRAMVHYWLCRYEDSRNALADFMDKYAKDVEGLNEFLDRQRLEPEAAYVMFENLISGVSSDSIGIAKSILQTAAEKDTMMLVRDQYASIVEEKQRLDAKGIFGSKGSATAKPLEFMDKWAGALRKEVGRRFLGELQDMKKDYDRLYAQAEFLYVELLMSEKDQILGKELHASSKITKVSQKMQVKGWGGAQAWKDAKNGEYWWDEVGWYISRVDSQCQAK